MKIYYDFIELIRNNKRFKVVNITVDNDAKTGRILNHNCEVDIFGSIGKKCPLFFNLI